MLIPDGGRNPAPGFVPLPGDDFQLWPGGFCVADTAAPFFWGYTIGLIESFSQHPCVNKLLFGGILLGNRWTIGSWLVGFLLEAFKFLDTYWQPDRDRTSL